MEKNVIVKEFIAETKQRALLDIKIEFNDDFDIIRKEPIEIGGIFGFFTKPGYKIVVRSPKKEKVQERVKTKLRKQAKSKSIEDKKIKEILTRPVDDNNNLSNMKKMLSAYSKAQGTKYGQSEQDTEILRKLFSNPVINPKAKEVDNVWGKYLNKDINVKNPGNVINLNNINKYSSNSDSNIERLSEEISKIKSAIHSIKNTVANETNKSNNISRGKFYEKYVKKLTDKDFPLHYAKTVLDYFEKTLNRIQLEDESLYEKKLREFIIDHIYAREGISITKQKKIALIGPTGVGKTTAIAKLAYYFKYELGKSVKVISLDFYKYGGIKQLQDLCKEMDVDFTPVYEKEQYILELENNDADVFLIDTAGKNYINTKNIEELRSYMDLDLEIERYLVLSSDAKYSDMHKINRNFSECNIKGVIFSKFDISEFQGSLIAFLIKSKNSVVYITYGTKIDGEIKEAIPYKLVDGLLK